MSGGSLDYFYSRFDEPLEKIRKELKWGKNRWTPETLSGFQTAVLYLRIAQIYSRRIEWLLSGDDGEDDFHERLNEELEEIRNNPEIIEPQLKKCTLCKEYNGKECNHRRWFEGMDNETFQKRLTDASDCYDFEEIDDML
ncbi:MAG: hypothetical protein K6E51_02550 [Treponema sp.]|nr:hypothetical protein [Treponema sp.]